MELWHAGLTAAFLGASGDEAGLLPWLGSRIAVWGGVVLGIGLVIFVHELGHFLAAKLFGVRVDKFYVGFDPPMSLFGIPLPRTLGKFRWGETEYGIGIIPLGGYVKMLGQDDDPRNAEAEAERIRQSARPDGPLPETESVDPRAGLDPRSYPAKSVPQRMVIISAGVVMNLITGVLFAAAAYGFGVPYTPAVVGSTTPGYAAWQAGVQPGGRIVAIGAMEDDPQLHFPEMMQRIFAAGIDAPDRPLPVRIAYDDEVREYQFNLRPAVGQPKLRMIGIGTPTAARLGEKRPAYPYSSAAEMLQAEDAGAIITAVEGEPLEVDSLVGQRLAKRLDQRLYERAAQPLTITLQSTSDAEETLERDVTLPPQREKGLGVTFAPSPITALVDGGPAAQAGVEVGDRIVAINGQSDFDALSLPRRVWDVSEEIVLTLRRGQGEAAQERDVTLVPSLPDTPSVPFSPTTGHVELSSLGIAYLLTSEIASIEEPSQQALTAGDRIQKITPRWPNSQPPAELINAVPPAVIEEMKNGWTIGPDLPMLAVLSDLQYLPTGTQLRVVATATDGTIRDVTLPLTQWEERYWHERGLVLTPVRLQHVAAGPVAALRLGLREAGRRATDVFSFLRMAFTGKISRDYVAGPVGIVQIAGLSAEAGPSRLLLFLTLLSVNLAILNFLPIPALDGGHMVFLTAEAVLGRPIDEQLQIRLTMAGVLALLSLMAFVIINDVMRIVGA